MPGQTYPLSLPQRDIYYEQLLYPNTSIYNIGAMVEVKGTLDAFLFQQAATAMVKQHGSLRSRFYISSSGPVMEIMNDAEPHVGYTDLSDQPDAIAAAKEFIQQEFEKPFDLNGSGLLNCYHLVKVSTDLFYIVGKYHHLVADGWSTSLLFTRLANNYACIKAGQQPDGPETSGYPEFIEDDLNYLSSEEFTADSTYWKNRCDQFGLPSPAISSSGSLPDGVVKSKRIALYLNRELYDRMIAFSSAHSVTVFHFLLAVTGSYLSALSDRRKLIFGLPLLNRKNKKFKGMVGLFAGISPLMTEMEAGRTFLDILALIRQSLREDFRHQRLPLSVVSSLSGRMKEGGRRSFYDVFFSYEKHDYSICFDGHPSTVLPLTHHQERAPLAIYIREFDDVKDVKVDFDYNISYFGDSFVAGWVRRLTLLIEELMNAPEKRIGEIGLVGEEESRLLLETFNDTRMDYDPSLTVTALLDRQVLQTPEAIALEHEGRTVSYRELSERSQALAAYLREQHATGPNDLVGIMMNRSQAMLVAILGIIRAGGAYVPIDPEHPDSRTAYILGQSAVKVVLTEETYRERLTGGAYAVVVLSPSNDLLLAYEHHNIDSINQYNDLLYVMYTSGSTGKPKGVEIEHRSVVNFLLSMQQKLAITTAHRLMAVTTYSFDISVLELLLPLVSGATVVLPTRRDIQDGGRLVQTIRDGHPDFLQCTPGMWQMLLDAGWHGDGHLKALCGGERMGRELAARLLPEVAELWNMYGPTETTIWSSIHRIAVSEDAASIGTPIANTEMYILNAGRQLLPVGITGELYIGGQGLARGYKDRPDLTLERFVENPFKRSQRIYRTGDMAMWRPDGTIAFFGRSDEQVKIRGYRVEPAEIEYSLSRHGQVNSAVVTAERGEDGSCYLVAYVVLTAPVTSAELRDFIRGLLPEYMIPGYFIVMDQLPLSANGKVDKRSLPKVADARLLGAGVTYEGAGSRLESELIRIWEEVLLRERIGIRDNFFELGGHSLRAVQILSRIHQETGVEIGLHQLFNHPRIADIARLIADRSSSVYEKITPVPQQPYYELSHAQRRLWVLSRFPEGSLAYNIAGAYRMQGKLNRLHFRRAFDQVIQRHESLRTVFITVQGVPMQQIKPAGNAGFSIQDYDLRRTGGWPLAEELAHRELDTPFDLVNGPLIRASLLQTDEEEYLFLLTLHHIITDGWSMEIIVREVMALYEAYEAGQPDPLQPLRIQYKDYAHWQNAQIDSPAIAKHREYWLNLLHGDLPVLQLPADYPRPDIQTYNGNLIEYRLDADLSRQVRLKSQQHHSTVFITLLALLKVLLQKYSGQTDILIGTPAAGRGHGDLYDLVGFFVNMIVMRTTVSDEEPFENFWRRVKETVIAGQSHQFYPFDKLVEQLNLPRDISRSPLFDIVAGMENTAFESDGFPLTDGLQTTPMKWAHRVSKYDLTLTFKDGGGDILLEAEYNTDLYKKETIKKFLDHFVVLAKAFLAAPEKRIGEIGLVGEEESRLLLETFNDTRMDYDPSLTVTALLDRQVLQTPEAIALEHEGRTVSYRELSERSQALAAYLREQHATGPNDLVGIMMNRSQAMLVAILGIIRAGGAYVPIDPEHPDSRTAYILGQSAVKVVLTEETYRERLTGGAYAVVVLSPSNDLLLAYEHRNIDSINQYNDLLYVMYTSGSTGKPKGVEIEHRSVVNFLLSMQQKLAITTAHRLMAVTTYSFDISVLELLLPLVSGATVVLPTRRDIQDGGRLVQTIRDGHPDFLQCTPGMWQMLLDAGWHGDGHLKALCGGERMGRELAARLLPEVAELWNMYGPTETTIWSSIHRIAVSEDAASIGTPIANTEMYILNAGRQLLPVGITGELYIGGQGLARGYKDRPDLTLERFVENPFKRSQRIYRTGDMAMWRPDGTIAFFGRSDEQVKIRGYRVEPAEIEYSLSRHGQVNSAVVTAERGEDGSCYLVAYVVLTAPVTSAELRDFIRGLLPEYMIPGYFIVMDQLPLSANGKVDKRSLPKVADARLLGAGVTYEGAGSRLESELIRIWEEVLLRERIGIRDNFFELGGHSLRAVQILSRIHQETGVEIGLHQLFNHPRIADIARLIADRSSSVYEKITPVPQQPYYELSHAQRRLWVLSRFPEGSLAYNIAGAYRMQGKLNRLHFRRAFDQVIQRHESLRTVFITVQGVPMQQIKPAGNAGFSIQDYDLRRTGGWPLAEELAHRELDTPFDLVNGPLIRASLLQTDEEEYLFLLTLHHIITDGWSMEIIVREVMALYEAYEAGQPDPLQPLRIQYKDYAHWQNAQIDSPAIAKHREYWLNLFHGDLPVLQLPADYPRPEVLSSQGDKVSHVIGNEDLQRIKTFAQRQGTSLYTILMSVTKVLLYRYTGQEDIIVGYPLSMRDYAELEAQVGVYLNAMPLRTRVEGKDSFKDVLSKVRVGVLRGHQHHSYPFDSLVHNLNLPIDMSRAPLFDVVVVLQNLAIHQQDSYRMGDMVIEIHDTGITTSSIDLRLEFIESAGHLAVNFEFNTGLFKARTIQTLLSRWLHLMRHVLDEPGMPIENIEFGGEVKAGMTNDLNNQFTMTFK